MALVHVLKVKMLLYTNRTNYKFSCLLLGQMQNICANWKTKQKREHFILSLEDFTKP